MELEKYASDYLQLMQHVYHNKHILNVSTITFICELSVKEIDLLTFINTFEEKKQNTKFNDITMKTESHGAFEVSKRGKVKKSFFNQITLNFKDINKKSIKIFSNGKLQLTGLTSQYECIHVSDYVVALLNYILPQTPGIAITKSYIGMLNSNFSVLYNIDLVKFNKILQQNGNCFSVYNPESYPAINLKIYLDENERSLSVFIFGTGNIVITGSKTLQEMQSAYLYITKLLGDHFVSRNTEYKAKHKRVEPYIEGYNIRQYLSCMS